MNGLLPALAALGILLLWSGLTTPSPRRSALGSRLDMLIAEAGVRGLTGVRLVVLSFGAGAFTFVLTAGITGAIAAPTAAALVATSAPLLYVKSVRDKRRRALREAWPDALATMVAGIRAGVSLPEICVGLAQKGPRDLIGAFSSYAATYRSTGSFPVALVALKSDLADPIADRVTASLALAHEVGGTDLVRVLRTLSDFVREDLRIRKEIEARWSWTVTAARVAAASPWIVLLIMSTRPEAAAAYDSASGAVVLMIGAIATILGYRLMLRAAQLPSERRLGR